MVSPDCIRSAAGNLDFSRSTSRQRLQPYENQQTHSFITENLKDDILSRLKDFEFRSKPLLDFWPYSSTCAALDRIQPCVSGDSPAEQLSSIWKDPFSKFQEQMASNDGQRLTVFGLTFRQHDNRYMQQILRHYGRLPMNPGNRAELYIELASVARDIDKDESHAIETWLRDGGEFPLTPIHPSPSWATVPSDGALQLPGYRERAFQPGLDDGDFEIDNFGAGDRTGDHVDFDNQLSTDYEEEFHFERENEERTADGEDEEEQEFAIHGHDTSELALTPTAVPSLADIECDVCMESFAASGFPPTSRITSSCDHEGICCLHCIQETIRTAISEGALNRLTCPMCPEKLSYQEIKAYASQEIFER